MGLAVDMQFPQETQPHQEVTVNLEAKEILK